MVNDTQITMKKLLFKGSSDGQKLPPLSSIKLFILDPKTNTVTTEDVPVVMAEDPELVGSLCAHDYLTRSRKGKTRA